MQRAPPNAATLGPLIDAIGPLRREGVLQQSPTIGNWFRAANILNSHALRRLNERVKNALDPAGILAPGKSGIWPAAYRREAGT